MKLPLITSPAQASAAANAHALYRQRTRATSGKLRPNESFKFRPTDARSTAFQMGSKGGSHRATPPRAPATLSPHQIAGSIESPNTDATALLRPGHAPSAAPLLGNECPPSSTPRGSAS